MSRTRVPRICENCKEPFLAWRYRVIEGTALFCSRKCTDAGKAVRSRSLALASERFWDKVTIGAATECWPWSAATDAKGYGRFTWGGRANARSLGAHRFALASADGLFAPDGALLTDAHALHSCDNPICCNPAHLRWGSNEDNIRDRVTRGRSPKGKTHHSYLRPETVPRGESRSHSRLTAEKAYAIRLRYARGGVTQQALADEYGLSRSSIEDVIHRRTWKHVV
jgi:hypothetical protein